MLRQARPPLNVAVIGAGIAGLCAAAELRAAGCEVTLFERAAFVGGKMRRIACADHPDPADGGPTVLTLRDVFERVFDALGARLAERVELRPLSVLARHAWCEGGRLDLYADVAQSADAIRALAGQAEADGYLRFCRDSQRAFTTLDRSFMQRPAPSLPGLIMGAGLQGLPDLLRLRAFQSLWQALGSYFRDPRLRQLFGRYATYCGSSPFEATATLMLVAHVEQCGVWQVAGGMHRLADALQSLLRDRGVEVRCGLSVARIELAKRGVAAVQTEDGERRRVDAVVATCDANALAAGLLGRAVRSAAAVVPLRRRSLSAMTWVGTAVPAGFDLHHHNVFFCDDYRAEFDCLMRERRMPQSPTVYICAQDRSDTPAQSDKPERLLCLINAPPTGDRYPFDEPEIDRCLTAMRSTLARCGLRLPPGTSTLTCTTPKDFHALFPGTGGALYGPSSHGWRASFLRPGVRTRIRGLYLAGGSVHPGPGLPMAALSGRQAAQCLLHDLASMHQWAPMATAGGISMR
jgi:1-hydroxycarotenoid 3,4-desaturase